MKILLVRPPYYAALGSEEKVGNVPLGLCYIAASLEAEGYDVLLFDGETLNLTERKTVGKAQAFLKWNEAYPSFSRIMKDSEHPVWLEVRDRILEEKPDLIGFTSYTPTMSFVNHVSKKLKAKADIPIMLGGPHPTALPELSLKESGADVVVIGEGERTVVELANELEKGHPRFHRVAGLAYKDEEGIHFTGERKRIDDLNSLPTPAFHLLDSSRYYKEAFGYMITSRGCPYRCKFCASHSIWGRKTRFRDVGSIVDEIVNLQKRYNLNVFRFADDLFPASLKKVEAFSREIKRRNCKIEFRCGSRVDTISQDILSALKDSGCNEISFGVESGSQRILDLIDKGTTKKEIKRAIRLTKQAGIRTIVFFMVGHPTETVSDIKESISLIHELDADRTLLNLVTPLPGTGLTEYAGGIDKLSKTWWKYYFQGKAFHPMAMVNGEALDHYFEQMCAWVAKRNVGEKSMLYLD